MPAAAGVALPAAPAGRAPAGSTPTVKRGAKSAAGKPVPAGLDTAEAGPAGGFHESSYELQSGLQITESEWPDDVTVPGSLGER